MIYHLTTNFFEDWLFHKGDKIAEKVINDHKADKIAKMLKILF